MSGVYNRVPRRVTSWLHPQHSPVTFGHEQRRSEEHYLRDGWTEQCNRLLVTSLSLVTRKAFSWSLRVQMLKVWVEPHCLRTNLPGHVYQRCQDAALQPFIKPPHSAPCLLSDPSIRVSGGWINRAEAARSRMTWGVNAWGLICATCERFLLCLCA